MLEVLLHLRQTFSLETLTCRSKFLKDTPDAISVEIQVLELTLEHLKWLTKLARLSWDDVAAVDVNFLVQESKMSCLLSIVLVASETVLGLMLEVDCNAVKFAESCLA